MLKHSYDIIRNGVLFQDIFFLLIPLFGAISLNSGGVFFQFFFIFEKGSVDCEGATVTIHGYPNVICNIS